MRFFRALSASDSAIATACFGGLPAAISVLMFSDTTRRPAPFLRGTGGNLGTWPRGCKYAEWSYFLDMQRLWLALLVLLPACSSSPAKPQGPCALRDGTYRVSYTQVDGDCGTISDTVATAHEAQSDVGATGSPAAPCTGTVAISTDNCATEIQNNRCPEAESGYSVTNGKATWAVDGSGGNGTVGAIGYDARGVERCQSTYDITWTRL